MNWSTKNTENCYIYDNSEELDDPIVHIHSVTRELLEIKRWSPLLMGRIIYIPCLSTGDLDKSTILSKYLYVIFK